MKFLYCTGLVLFLLTTLAVPAPPIRDHFERNTDSGDDESDNELIRDLKPYDNSQYAPLFHSKGHPTTRLNPINEMNETEFSKSYTIFRGNYNKNCNEKCRDESMECSFEDYPRLSEMNVKNLLGNALKREFYFQCNSSVDPLSSTNNASGNQPFISWLSGCIYGYVGNAGMAAASCAVTSEYFGKVYFCPCKKQLPPTADQTIKVPSFPTSPSFSIRNSDCYNSSENCIAPGYGLTCYDNPPFKNTTFDGKDCINWFDSKKYISHLLLKPPQSRNHNKCINPNNYTLGPWCYTSFSIVDILQVECWTKCSGPTIKYEPSTSEGKISVTPETSISTEASSSSRTASTAMTANASEISISTASLKKATPTAAEASSTKSSFRSQEMTTTTVPETTPTPLATTPTTFSEASTGSTETVGAKSTTIKFETETTTNSTEEDARQERIKKYVAVKMRPVIISIAILVLIEVVLLGFAFREWGIRKSLIKEEESMKNTKKNSRPRKNSKVRRSSAKVPKKSSVDNRNAKPQGRRPSRAGKM